MAHSSPAETIDPEALQARVARFFQHMETIVARYDGTVDQLIGDAVMAVFGVPLVHEDDALRALRAADEARTVLAELGLAGRIGVMTGEAVTGEGAVVTGEVVSAAKRMAEAATPGEILIGQPTLELVRIAGRHRAGRATPERHCRPPPLASWRRGRKRGRAAPFVGRKAELSFLRESWDLVRSDRRCELVTVVGEAGVGKSRLAAEFRASIEATVVEGRCPPYGEGITYLPVVEVLRQLDLRPEDEAAAAAISSLLGETDTPTSADEIAWAVRKVLAQAAAERPLVVLFDDLQWGEEAFLNLVEQAALLSSDTPILLLCLARPELTERRPSWPVALRLGTLDDEAVDELIPKRVPADARARIARAAGGNPLFVEEMLAVVGEADADISVPPTLQALLATRLDQLESAERSVLEGAAIEGEVFHRGAVQALAPDLEVTTALASLVRKGLVKPDQPRIRGEDGLRFHHILIRDAAYNALPKTTRAQLHQRFAAWLDAEGTRARRAGRARRLSPRAGSCLPPRARSARGPRAEGGGKAAPPGGRSTRGSPSGLRRRGDSVPARRRARARVGGRFRRSSWSSERFCFGRTGQTSQSGAQMPSSNVRPPPGTLSPSCVRGFMRAGFEPSPIRMA